MEAFNDLIIARNLNNVLVTICGPCNVFVYDCDPSAPGAEPTCIAVFRGNKTAALAWLAAYAEGSKS